MSVTIIETNTSRKFTSSATRGTGEWVYTLLVEGEANPETAIIAAVTADAPFFWYGLARQEVQGDPVAGRTGGGIYTVTVPYLWELNNAAAQDPTYTPGAGSGPGGGDPSGTPTGPATADTPLGPNVSLEIGGRPPRLTTSIAVISDEGAGGGPAPDHGKLINYNRSTNEVDGVELDDPACVMPVEVTFDSVSMGFISLLEGAVWHKNDDTWFHRSAGSVVFLGANINSDANSRARVNFRFGLRSAKVIEAESLRDDVGQELPGVDITMRGFDYLEIEYENATDAGTGLMVAKPSALRVHEVLPDFDFALFGIGS